MVFGFEVGDLVGREDRHPLLFSEEGNLPEPPPASHGSIVRKLHEHVLPPEGLPETVEDLLRLIAVVGEDEVGEEPKRDGPGQTNQAFRVV